MRDTERQRHRQRENQALCRKPDDVGLDSGIPGSCPEPKADPQVPHLPEYSFFFFSEYSYIRVCYMYFVLQFYFLFIYCKGHLFDCNLLYGKQREKKNC